jgi:hypothetical protein
LPASAAPGAGAASSSPAAPSTQDHDESLGGVIKRLLTFGRKRTSSGGGSVEPAVAPGMAPLPAAAPASPESVTESPSHPEAVDELARRVMAQSGQLDTALARAQREAAEVTQEISNPKAKRFVDGLMSELVAERARLADLAKTLNLSVRQKELEFRNRERVLQEEIRKKDDAIRTGNTQLARTKEQLTQVRLTLDRMKAGSAGHGEDPHLKQKFAQSQRLLSVTKDENAKLKAKVDELKNSLSAAQLAAASNKGPSPQEFSALQNKYLQSQRLIEDFKRQRELLMEKLDQRERELKERPAAPLGEDIRKRLESAMQKMVAMQRSSERLQLRVTELASEETRLKRELAMAQDELRGLKAERHPSSSDAPAGGDDGPGSIAEAMNDAARSAAGRSGRSGTGGEGSGSAA